MKWSEEQHRLVAFERVTSTQDIKGPNIRGSIKGLSSGGHQRHTAFKASKRSRTSDKRKQLKARSPFSSVNPSRASKPREKYRYRRQKTSILHDAFQAAEKAIIDSCVAQSISKRLSKIKDTMCTSLRPIYSSRVLKLGGKRISGLQENGTKGSTITDWRRNRRESKTRDARRGSKRSEHRSGVEVSEGNAKTLSTVQSD